MKLRRVVWVLPLLQLFGCVTVPEDEGKDATGYGKFTFGMRIEDFDSTDLELIGGDSLSLFDCDVSLPLELSSYFRQNEVSPYPGVVIDQVEYLFCFNGTAVEFCGVNIQYSSEEYDATDGLDPHKSTNHRRFMDELVKAHGKPNTGDMPNDSIIIENLEGTEAFLLPRSLKFERHTWCAPGDHCDPNRNSIVAQFSPVMGEGQVLIATPRLVEFGAAYQRYSQYPYPVYQALYNAEPATARKLHTRCKGESITKAGELADSPLDVDVETALKNLLSEQSLESAAVDKNLIRPVLPHGMTATEFFDTLHQTLACRYDKSYSEEQRSYCIGMERGTTRRYFLGRFTTTAEEQKWLAAKSRENPYLREVSAGYVDGTRGVMKLPPKK